MMYQVRNIAISKLKDYENNPRNIDLAVEKVKMSIERFGFLFPIVTDINNVIVCGHCRKQAATELGLKQVPCICADDLTQEQIDLFRLVDNKTSEYSEWDFEKLGSELKSINLDISANKLLIENFELDIYMDDFNIGTFEIPVEKSEFLSSGKDDEIDIGKGDNSKLPNIYSNNDNTESGKTENDEIEDDNYANEDYQQNNNIQNIHDNEESANYSNISDNKENQKLIGNYLFRIGSVSFAISPKELDALNREYVDYLDNYSLEKSFVQYIKERHNVD
jgi:hypothetical protein